MTPDVTCVVVSPDLLQRASLVLQIGLDAKPYFLGFPNPAESGLVSMVAGSDLTHAFSPGLTQSELALFNLTDFPRSRAELSRWLYGSGVRGRWSAAQCRCFNKIWWLLVD